MAGTEAARTAPSALDLETRIVLLALVAVAGAIVDVARNPARMRAAE